MSNVITSSAFIAVVNRRDTDRRCRLKNNDRPGTDSWEASQVVGEGSSPMLRLVRKPRSMSARGTGISFFPCVSIWKAFVESILFAIMDFAKAVYDRDHFRYTRFFEKKLCEDGEGSLVS